MMIESEKDLKDYIELKHKHEGEIHSRLHLFLKLSGINTHDHIYSWDYFEDSKRIYFETTQYGDPNSTDEFLMPVHYLWTEDWKDILKEETRRRKEKKEKKDREEKEKIRLKQDDKERVEYERLRAKFDP